MRPRWRAAAMASAVRAETWAVKALVEATATSGPALVGQKRSTSRAMVEPCELTTAAVCSPLALHQRRAARVSAVSPDWEMPTARVLAVTAGSR